MRRIKLVAAMTAMCLTFTLRVLSQEHDSIQNECDSLQNASSSDLVQYLHGIVPNERNGDCITWAMRKLGKDQFEAAIPTLARLLDFRRPPTPREKRGYVMHPQGISDLYPAAGALELFGKQALPAVLNVMRADSSSTVARENSVGVWMEIYRQSDEQPKGVALLKQEESKTDDDAIRRRLKWATDRAVTYCNPPDVAACRRAAATGAP